MKKIIIIGCFLSFFILVMVPSIPALKFEMVREKVQSIMPDELENLDIKELREKLKESLSKDTQNTNLFDYLMVLLLIIYSRNVREEDSLLSLMCLLLALNIILSNLLSS